MIIRRHRRFTVKMGDYEMYSFGADIEMGHEDLGITNDRVSTMTSSEHAAMVKRLTEAVLGALEEQLIGEVQEAAELTEHKRSFILRAITDAPAKPKAKPRKATAHAS